MPHSYFLYSKREIHQVLDVLLLKTQKLDLLIKESCSDIHGTSVEVLSCSGLVAVIRVTCRDNETTTEVDLSGILQ